MGTMNGHDKNHRLTPHLLALRTEILRATGSYDTEDYANDFGYDPEDPYVKGRLIKFSKMLRKQNKLPGTLDRDAGKVILKQPEGQVLYVKEEHSLLPEDAKLMNRLKRSTQRIDPLEMGKIVYELNELGDWTLNDIQKFTGIPTSTSSRNLNSYKDTLSPDEDNSKVAIREGNTFYLSSDTYDRYEFIRSQLFDKKKEASVFAANLLIDWFEIPDEIRGALPSDQSRAEILTNALTNYVSDQNQIDFESPNATQDIIDRRREIINRRGKQKELADPQDQLRAKKEEVLKTLQQAVEDDDTETLRQCTENLNRIIEWSQQVEDIKMGLESI